MASRRSGRPTRRWALASSIALVLCVWLAGCGSDQDKLQSFMDRGDAYLEAEDFEEAIIEYRNALQIDPNHAPAHEGLANSYLQTKKIAEGYWELSEAIRLDPGNIDARLTYGALSLAARRPDEVLEQAEAIIAIDADNAPAHLLLGQAYGSTGRGEEATAPLERAIVLDPDDGSYRAILATHYKNVGRRDDSEQQLREGLARDPLPLLWTLLAQMLIEDGKPDEAEQALRSSVETAGTRLAAVDAESDELEARGNDLSQAYVNLAGFYFQEERADDGVAVLREGIEKAPNRQDLTNLLARYYRSIGDPETAEAILVEATEVDPTDPEPFLVVSTVRGQQGDLEGALAYADKALAADPTSVKARLRKAELLIDAGVRNDDPKQREAGRAIVSEVLAEAPANPEGLFVLAKLQISEQDVDGGIQSLRAALDGRPNWPQAHLVLGSALLLEGELQRARAELAKAVELDPSLVEARRLLVQVHSNLGEHEYAVEHGQAYLKARPDDDRTRILIAQSQVRLGKTDDAKKVLDAIPDDRRTVDVLYAIGRLQAATGQAAAARASMLEANTLRPNNARILRVLLELDRQDGKLSHSIKRVNDAIAASPDDPALWQLKGIISTYAGDPKGAEQAFEKAIELDPTDVESYQNLARLYAATGRIDETIVLYEQAVDSQPENAAAHHFLGVLYEMTGRTEDARGQYELALRYDPTLGETKNNLAYLLAESGEDLDRALKLAQEAKASLPDSANAADTLGWVLYKRGVASAAVGYLREAVQVADPEDPALGEIRTHLSLAYEATGDVDKAISTLEKALSDLEQLKRAGKLQADPPWAAGARDHVARLKNAG